VVSEESEWTRLRQGKRVNETRIAIWNGINAKLKTDKRGQKAELTGRGTIKRRRYVLGCSVIEEEEEEEEQEEKYNKIIIKKQVKKRRHVTQYCMIERNRHFRAIW